MPPSRLSASKPSWRSHSAGLAAAAPALADGLDRAVPVELADPLVEVVTGDGDGLADPPGFPLVGVADIDDPHLVEPLVEGLGAHAALLPIPGVGTDGA